MVSHHPLNHHVLRACGSPSESRSVFHNFSNKKDIFLYNALLSSYVLYRYIILLFVELVSVAELLPDNFMLSCVVKACIGLIEVELRESLHALALKLGLCSYSFVGNALIAMYGKCGFVESAFKVFEKRSQRNLLSWNSIMLMCSENRLFGEICGLFKELLLNGGGDEGSVSDIGTMVTMVLMVAAMGEVNLGMLLHGLALKLSFFKLGHLPKS
ncbi:pentatricopeptide repeat-containing protein At1g18485-like [Arachis hypogaea]|uniref:pentatricopeptide repeat-containing protein At1g18485-like n=1 Tax=Arachis hypogaea TaxID=3818 RepID=UPI003B217FA9